MRISVTCVMLSSGNKGPCIVPTDFITMPSFVFDSFGLNISLIVILINFSHSSNSSKLPTCENLQFYRISVF